MLKPSVTIVITTRDRAEMARRAVRSALAQTHAAVEVIVVDDGSIDPFQTDIDHPNLCTVRNDQTRGVAAARNVGIKHANGLWITFLDDDDHLLPTMVESSLEAAEESVLPVPIAVLSASEVVDAEGHVLEIRYPPTLLKGAHYFLEDQPGVSFQTHASLLAPLEVVQRMGGWDEALPASEHDDFFLRLNAVCSIQGNAEITYRILEHQSFQLHLSTLNRAIGMEGTVTKHIGIFRQHPQKYAHYLATIGLTYLRSGRWWPAIAWTTKALLKNPLRLKYYLWWLASLSGPRGLQLYRSLRSRRGSNSPQIDRLDET